MTKSPLLSIAQLVRLLHGRHTFLHPLRHRFALHEVGDELLHTNLDVELIRSLGRPVWFASIVQHPCRLAETLQCHEVFDTLIPRHMTVLIVMHNQNRSLYLIHQEQRRVFVVTAWVIPWSGAQTALGMFVLERTCQARTPTDTTVSTEHIHYRSTRFDSSEQTGTGCQISYLITAPAMTLRTNLLFVYITT